MERNGQSHEQIMIDWMHEDKGGVEGDFHISGLSNMVDGGANY